MPILDLKQAHEWLHLTSVPRPDHPEDFRESIFYCYDVGMNRHLIWLSHFATEEEEGGSTEMHTTCKGVSEGLRAAIHKSIFRGWTVTEGNSVRAFDDHIHGFPAATMTVDDLKDSLEGLPNGAKLMEELRTVLGKARTGTTDVGGSGDSAVVGSEATES